MATAKRFAELQADFQNAVLTGDASVLATLCESPADSRETRLSIYQTAYGMRLVEAMRASYEFLHRYVGEETFSEIGQSYVAGNPSHHPNIRWYGHALPEFLAGHAPYADYPILSELATLERALNDAFDAADDDVLAPQDLGAIDPARWQDLVLVPHASARRLRFATNAAAVWGALKDDVEVPEAATSGAFVHHIVWRQDATPMLCPLGVEEAMMWDEAAACIPFGQLCALLATFDDPDGAAGRAAGYLGRWVHGGLLASAQLD